MTARTYWAAPFFALVALSAPIEAATPRQTLSDAAFDARDKEAALAQIARAESGAAAQLARMPGDADASLTRAMAIGYRAKLTKNAGDAKTARRMFEALAAANPRDPEAIAAVGTWHLDSVGELGGLLAGIALGAKKATGLQALDRAVALGGNRAMFSGLAGLLRLSLDPKDVRGRQLIESAAAGKISEPIDRIMQRSAIAVLVPLRAKDYRAVEALAKQLLPFGRVPH